MDDIQAQALLLTVLHHVKSLKKNEFVAFDGFNFGLFYIHPEEQKLPIIRRRKLLNDIKSNFNNVMFGEWETYRRLEIKTTDLPDLYSKDEEPQILGVFYFQESKKNG